MAHPDRPLAVQASSNFLAPDCSSSEGVTGQMSSKVRSDTASAICDTHVPHAVHVSSRWQDPVDHLQAISAVHALGASISDPAQHSVSVFALEHAYLPQTDQHNLFQGQSHQGTAAHCSQPFQLS
eukprot:scaffold294754_cov25-Prasinocladus_malaysianus.AAC.1